ncbi:MAG: hypothetical protein PHY92_06605 [Alphaproteobacteria bacterium]|nr:hypothetical protein [Alphaproteobacteria bacterium]
MKQTTYTKEQFWAELDSDGEDKVRLNLALKKYGDVGDKRALVEEWLHSQERRRRNNSNFEQIRIALSTRNAAWIASIFAGVSAMAAIIAAVK